MMKKKDVTVVGPLNIDLLITGKGPPDWAAIPNWDGPAQMEMTAAGSVGYNVSDLAKLGVNVAVSSCVPDDPLGLFIVNALQNDGVDTVGVRLVPETVCGIGVYMLLFGSRKRPLVYRLPTHEPWPQTIDPAELDRLLNARLLHNGGYLHFKSVWNGSTDTLFMEAKKRNLITTMDPQFPLFAMEPPWIEPLRGVLPFVDIFLCDETEARNLTAENDLAICASAILELGPSTVVIKQGKNGATVYQAGLTHHQPAIHLGELVDSIGAGDAFDSGFIYGVLAGWPIEKCALFAAIAAAYTVIGVGGSNSFPEIDEIVSTMQTLSE
jgi:2-dehydro-3-deoxygluconokinase